MTDVDDVTLVRQCLSGNERAFESLLDRYQGRIFNAVLRMVQDWDDARDLTQTVFAKAYENLSRYDPDYKFFSWIYRIAMNESLNFVERRGRHARVTDGQPMSDPVSDVDVHREAVTNRDLREALNDLKPEYRSAVILKHILGCSYREMSFILDLPEKTVKSRLYTARELLRRALTDDT